MSSDLQMDDYTLQEGAVGLVYAAETMITDNVKRPSEELESLTGIGPGVTLYLKGMSVARAALADAARTSSDTVAAVMSESTELDTFISTMLGDGFAVQGYES